MNPADADTGEVLWTCSEWDMSVESRDEHFPAELLSCQAVAREINFTSKQEIKNFHLIQENRINIHFI